jgi:hypothetical protein
MKPLDKKSARMLVRFLGVGGIVLGVVILWQGGGRPTGPWSWVTGPIFDVGGNTGLAIFHIGAGLFLSVIGFRKNDKG